MFPKVVFLLLLISVYPTNIPGPIISRILTELKPKQHLPKATQRLLIEMVEGSQLHRSDKVGAEMLSKMNMPTSDNMQRNGF